MRIKRVLVIWALIFVLCAITVAYAALQTTLTISGSVTKKGGIWNVKLENVSAPTLTGTAIMSTPPFISGSTLRFGATLKRANDSVAFTFEITNAGTIDATLSDYSIQLGDNVPTAESTYNTSDITYMINYADGSYIAFGDTLVSGQTRTFKVVLSYDDVQVVSPSDVNLIVNATFNYVQL